jgi:hypothetical protein
MTFTATVKVVRSFETPFGLQTLFVMEDAAGNTLKYKSGSVSLCEVGDTVTFVATVKEHGEYNGTKQTVLSRAKVA